MKAEKSNNTSYGMFLNEKGLALVMVLILSAIGLAIMAGLIYMLTSGTQISGIQKRYRTALEAGIGAAENTYAVFEARDPANPGCLTTKILNATSAWGGCSNSFIIDPTNVATYDLVFTVGDYNVYAKIVDTVQGNTAGGLVSRLITNTGVVENPAGKTPLKSIPYLYTIEIDAQNAANPAERGKYSILYQY